MRPFAQVEVPPSPKPVFDIDMGSYISNNPQTAMLFGGIMAYYVYSRLKGEKKLKRSAHWAIAKHVSNAKLLALTQMASNEMDDYSFFLGKLPIYDVITSILAFGAPKTGKSYGVTNMAIYEHLKRGQPQVIVDLQWPEQSMMFVYIAQMLGYSPDDIHMFVPGEPCSDIWNMVEHAVGTKAQEMARMLTANSKMPGQQTQQFFDDAMVWLLSGTMSMLRQIKGLGDVLGCKAFLETSDLLHRLIARKPYFQNIDSWAYDQFSQIKMNKESEKTVANILGSAMNMFQGFSSPDITPALLGETSFPMYLEGKKLLIIGCKPNLRRSVSPLLMALLGLVVETNAVHGRQSRLQIAIDEFTAVKYPNLVANLAEIRKYHVYFNLATQNLRQVTKQFGPDDTPTFLGTVGNKFWLNPRSNDSAKYLSDGLGKLKTKETSYTTGTSGENENTSRSRQTKVEDLLPMHEIMMMPQGQAIVQSRGYCEIKRAPLPRWLGGQKPKVTKEYIPYRTFMEPTKEYKAAIKKAKQAWPFTLSQLEKYSPQQQYDGKCLFTSYEQKVNDLMPKEIPAESVKTAAYHEYESAYWALL